MLPRHLGLLLLGGRDEGLGDVARRGGLGVFLGDTPLSEVGLGGQGRRGLVEAVERRVVGEVERVEVVLVQVEVVGVGVGQPVLLLRRLV